MGKKKKPSPVERLSKIAYTGAISDILDEMGLYKQVLPKEIQSLHPGRTVAGRALTILGEPSESDARGAVIDGGARDTDYILELGFPVFARYRTPIDIVGRWHLVAYNVPIQIGHVHIEPGDYILGDRDGVIAVPQEVAEGLAQPEFLRNGFCLLSHLRS